MNNIIPRKKIFVIACTMAFCIAGSFAHATTVIIKGITPYQGEADPSPLTPEQKILLLNNLPPQAPDRVMAGPLYFPPQFSPESVNPPPYVWRHGCGPTTAGMIIGYWDAQGFVDLVSGSAGTQSDDVNNAIGNQQHYDDYCLPIDDIAHSTVILLDKSSTGGAHITNNCLADFIYTSRSNYDGGINPGLRYGWSYETTGGGNGMHIGMQNYVSFRNTNYTPATTSSDWRGGLLNAASWTAYKTAIDNNRPVCLGVDSDGDGAMDHFVCGIGYTEVGGTKQYICYNTWDTSQHTYDWVPDSSYQEFSVTWGTFFSVTGSSNSISGAISSSTAPISGVLVTSDIRSSSSTASGAYALYGLYPGTHTVIPALAGYTFTAQNVYISNASKTNINFTGTYIGPFDHYEITMISSQLVLGVPATFRIRAISTLGYVCPDRTNTLTVHVNSGSIDISSATLAGGEVSVQITLTDSASTVSFWVESGGVTSARIAAAVAIPAAANLAAVRVFPNPCYAGDTIEFSPLGSAHATISIFNIAGRLVKEISVTPTATSSLATWNLKNDDGENTASGIYIYLIKDDAGNIRKGKFAIIR